MSPSQRDRDDETTAWVGAVVLLAAWTMALASLLFAWALFRVRAPSWPPPGTPSLPGVIPTAAVAVLVVSGLALVLARRRAAAWGAGLVVGALCLGAQAWSWRAAWGAGLRPWSGGAYGSLWYTLSGFHAANVVAGMLALAAGLRGRGRAAAACWGFVAAAAVVLHLALYVL